jgi:outer membrane PBP1 activator LpoA protein
MSPLRRAMLLAAPTGAALASLPSLASASQSGIGLVLPATERVAGSRADWLSGFMSEQQWLGVVSPVVKTVYVTGPSSLKRATEALLQSGVQTLAGWADANSVADLSPVLDAHGARFLVSDLGAKSIRGALPNSVERGGMNLWQRAYDAGESVANRGAKTALVATSFYESGFDLVGAFARGFREAGGARLEVTVTGTPELAHGEQAWQRIDTLHPGFRPEAVFALYSGREAVEFAALARSRFERVKQASVLAMLSTR